MKRQSNRWALYVTVIVGAIACLSLSHARALTLPTPDECAEATFDPTDDDTVGALARFRPRCIMNVFNVKAFGAKGDGSNDDSGAIEAAISLAIRRGAAAVLIPASESPYLISRTLEVDGPIKIIGGYPQPTIRQTSQGQGAFSIRSSNVELTNLRLLGSGSSNYVQSGATAIDVEGSSATSYIRSIALDHLTINDWFFNGIYGQFVDDFSVHHNRISSISYAGMQWLSSNNGHIYRNEVSDINGIVVGPDQWNGYGISITKDLGDDAEFPTSEYFVIEDNTISNIPLWEGLDTHGGWHIVFRNNAITQCLYGIVVTTAPAYKPDGYIYASHDIDISGNNIKQSGLDGVGIQVGATYAEYPAQQIVVEDNRIEGYGDISTNVGSAVPGAMGFYNVESLIVDDNTGA